MANATAAHGALKGAVGSTVDVFGNLTTVLNVNGSQIISTTSAAQQLANAMSGDQAAADMLKASQQDLITTMQVGDSTITTVTSNVDLEAAAFEKLSQAMDQAAAAADGFTSANNAAGSSGGGAGAGGPRRLRPACGHHAVAKDGGQQPRCTAAMAQHTPGGQHAHCRH